MTATNDITGHLLMTKAPSQAYKDNYDRIFRKGNPDKEKQDEKQDEAKPSQVEVVRL